MTQRRLIEDYSPIESVSAEAGRVLIPSCPTCPTGGDPGEVADLAASLPSSLAKGKPETARSPATAG